MNQRKKDHALFIKLKGNEIGTSIFKSAKIILRSLQSAAKMRDSSKTIGVAKLIVCIALVMFAEKTQ